MPVPNPLSKNVHLIILSTQRLGSNFSSKSDVFGSNCGASGTRPATFSAESKLGGGDDFVRLLEFAALSCLFNFAVRANQIMRGIFRNIQIVSLSFSFSFSVVRVSRTKFTFTNSRNPTLKVESGSTSGLRLLHKRDRDREEKIEEERTHIPRDNPKAPRPSRRLQHLPRPAAESLDLLWVSVQSSSLF